MAINTYDIGDKTRIVGTFKSVAGAAVDPTTVTLKIKRPVTIGGETSYVYGVEANLFKDSTGVYHYDLTLTTSGDWTYRWVGTGAVVAADETFLTVKKSAFAAT